MTPVQFHGRNWLPGCATLLSIVACYGTLFIVSLLSIAGLSVSLPTGPWAVTITVFAAVAALAIANNYRRHHSLPPLLLAALGAGTVAWVMLGSYDRLLEIAGFLALIIAAVWDRRITTR